MRTSEAMRTLASLLALPRCGVCGAGCRPVEALCGTCTRSLRDSGCGVGVVAGIGPVSWAAEYRDAARGLITALKFDGRLSLVSVAATAIVSSLPCELGRPTVVPVPAAPLRRRRRGFDPAELIAARVAVSLELPFAFALSRRDGPRQVGRSRTARIAAPPRVRAATAPAPRTVLLVDDVLTTGATASACATALREAGSVELRAAVFARALGGGPDEA